MKIRGFGGSFGAFGEGDVGLVFSGEIVIGN